MTTGDPRCSCGKGYLGQHSCSRFDFADEEPFRVIMPTPTARVRATVRRVVDESHEAKIQESYAVQRLAESMRGVDVTRPI